MNDHLHNKGTDRLLADVHATPAQCPRVEAVMTEVIESVRRRVGPGHTVTMCMRMKWINGQSMPRTAFAVTIVSTDEQNRAINSVGGLECDDAYAAGREALRLFAEDQYRSTVESRVRREMALAAKIDVGDYLARLGDDGSPSMLQEPLLKLGPGGDFVREVRP